MSLSEAEAERLRARLVQLEAEKEKAPEPPKVLLLTTNNLKKACADTEEGQLAAAAAAAVAAAPPRRRHRSAPSINAESRSIRPPAQAKPLDSAAQGDGSKASEHQQIMLVKLAAQWELRKFYERKGLQVPKFGSRSAPQLLGSASAPKLSGGYATPVHRRAPPPPSPTGYFAEPPAKPASPPEPRALTLAKKRGLLQDPRLLELNAPKHRAAPRHPGVLERHYKRAVQRELDAINGNSVPLHVRLPHNATFRTYPRSKRERLFADVLEAGINSSTTVLLSGGGS